MKWMRRRGDRVTITTGKRAGSNIAITADTYSHVLPGMQEAAAEAVEQLLRRSDQG